MVSLNEIYKQFTIDILPTVWSILFYIAPIVLIVIAYKTWIHYKTAVYIKNIDWVLLEIKMPTEITKSPKAMEIVFSAIHHTVDGHWWKKLTEGMVRAWFSLEIVSFSGEVHFFIRTPLDFRNLLESQIYSQYPNVEIFEAKEDYVNAVSYGQPDSKYDIWGTQLQFTKEDAYPIKTYVDYGLDADPKEEFKIDPMTPIIEFLGSIKAGEQIWVQILIQASKSRFSRKKSFLSFEKIDWKGQGEDLVAKIKEESTNENGQLNLTEGQKESLKAVERNISKLGFDCGIRSIHIGPKESFDKTNNGAMVGMMKQFNSESLNGLKPYMVTGFDYPWQDVRGKRVALKKRMLIDAYRRRSYFYSPYSYKPMVLNTEELATIFHFPGQVASAPNLSRIESKKGEPPINLPL